MRLTARVALLGSSRVAIGQMIRALVVVLMWVGVASAQLGASPAPAASPQIDVTHLLWGSGPVVRLVLLLLVGYSVGCWGIAIAKTVEMRKARRQSSRFTDIFWDTKNLTAVHTATGEFKESPVAQVFRAGYQEMQKLQKAKRAQPEESDVDFGGIENVQRAMHRARTQEVTRLERGLTFLATTASTAPFIGLFGTVWGIMTAFLGLSSTTSSSIQAVAPGIAEALIATAVGLAAAIPAVVMYNRFARQVRVLTAEMDSFGSEFLNIAERHFLSR